MKGLQMNILSYIQVNGGITLNTNNTVFKPVQGFSVSLLGYEKRFKLGVHNAEFLAAIAEYQYSAASMNERTGLVIKIGVWLEKGILYLDLSQYIDDFETAKYLAIKRQQQAFFDFKTNETIYVIG